VKHRRHLVADRALRSDLVVVSLRQASAFSPRLVEAEEPVGVQALGSELAIQAFDEGIVDRLARPAKVERDAAHEGPQIELLADELRKRHIAPAVGIKRSPKNVDNSPTQSSSAGHSPNFS
jgi:hypothetical protein